MNITREAILWVKKFSNEKFMKIFVDIALDKKLL